jgi:hypothetical protein
MNDSPQVRAQKGLVFPSFKGMRVEEMMDAIFKTIQKMNDGDHKQIMIQLFKFVRIY